PKRVWQAITDPDQMQEWHLPGTSAANQWKITEVIPDQKISYEWRLEGFPGNSRVTFEVVPDGDGAKLIVTHTGLEAQNKEDIQEGWDFFIHTQLKSFLDKPDAKVVIERTYDASVERVWAAITDPDQMRQWYMPLNDFRPEVGFETGFDVETKDKKKKFPHIWKVTEVIPGRKISYEWKFAGTPGTSIVTFELIPIGQKTKLTLTHIGLDSFRGYQGLETTNFREGWTNLLGTKLMNFLAMAAVPVG
ncbi:MAG: SRPBCC domain-containing protein, partial [Bacteroidetes bacterium]|nr:SRPBCC domain-containing protein [Bacteroidota bacterium]